MKRIILFTAIGAVIFTGLVSCKKEAKQAVAAPVQSGTVAELIKNLTLQDNANTQFFELGVVFKSAVKGNIKSVKVDVPVTGNKLVTLWKVIDQSVVESRPINCSYTNAWKDSVDVNIPIEANTEYIISINAETYYTAAVPAATFPFVNGDIILLGYKAHNGPAQSFPTDDYNGYAFGFVDFTFQKTL